jgi:thioredoxin reductase (NADPH)
VQAKAFVVAAGARYRRLDLANLKQFEGRGVWYWASPIEARMCRKEEAVVVGGGNSAGQAAVFLSGFAKKIWMLVRSPSLAETMSRYLIDRIAATENIEVLYNTEVIGLRGSDDSRLEQVRWKNRQTGQETECQIRNLFLFIGALPATDWLRPCGVTLDAKGFVQTGGDLVLADSSANDRSGAPMPLESSTHGLFAVGDVRSGSVKRVGAAIGEGAAVVAELHSFLAGSSIAARPRTASS